jgi:hypothetical protein
VGGQGVRVVRRVVPEGQHRAGLGVQGDHGALTLAELLAGLGLEVGPDRRLEVPDLVLADEQVGEAPELLLGGVADQLLVVGALEAGGPEPEGVEAGDRGEQVALGVLPLVLELVVHRHRAGDDRAVGGGDGPPVAGVVAAEDVDVLRVLAQLLGLEDLDVVEHGEQGQVADAEEDPQAADAGVHAGTGCPPPGRLRRPSRSDWRRVVSSEMRMSRARIT